MSTDVIMSPDALAAVSEEWRLAHAACDGVTTRSGFDGRMLTLAERIGQLRTMLQRATNEKALTFGRLQNEVAPWVEHNFGVHPAYQPLLGVVEEVGELAHSQLKAEQGIRGSAVEHEAAAKDAVADIVIYLADYCNQRGFDFQAIMEQTWTAVKARDWQANPTTGSTDGAA